jgi:hypothetical protein
MKLFCLAIFLVSSIVTKAQTNNIYKFSSQIDSVIQHDTVPWCHQPAA